MSHDSYALPAKSVAAGALFTNDAGQVLLVNPTYKPEWEIPGGLVEANEAPRAACMREVEEEINLRVKPMRLLSLDYRPAPANRADMLRLVFWGGRLDERQIAAIRLPEEELSDWGFFDIAQARQLLTPSLGEVVARCLKDLATAGTHYLEFTEAVDVPRQL